MFKHILDFPLLDFVRLFNERISLRDLTVVQNFSRLLRSYGLYRCFYHCAMDSDFVLHRPDYPFDILIQHVVRLHFS